MYFGEEDRGRLSDTGRSTRNEDGLALKAGEVKETGGHGTTRWGGGVVGR